ncbi:MAG TPA: 3-oxoacyl-[acyl-carrier-protein] reductase [Nitrospirales bacterium]|nr:3-oxoacyl-[acyl-carrier-protein] reductase [Nitrospirales bacterium]HIN33938.1 3-oxoacyl-[acyl-carrier-protein] reductase [Nitrospirales bacterium]
MGNSASGRLDGQIALVTGGAQGIGKAIATSLARDGAHVIIGDLNAQEAESIAAEIVRSGSQSSSHALNVADLGSVKSVIKRVVGEWEKIDILVNNAGITKDGLLLRLAEDAWDQVLSVNLTGAFYCTKAVLPSMVKNRSGRIVSIASIVGAMGNPGQANYAASKGGLIAFTKVVAREYASRGITANAVAPGFIDTAMTQAMPPAARESLIKQIPCGRLGAPEDIAQAVSFLVSKEASYITGQVLHVNGGMLMA